MLSDFSLVVEPGECLTILGESGCGKSTLLHCVCALIPRSIPAEMTGVIRLFGRPVGEYPRHELAQNIGIVFQNPETQLFCDTVEDELAFGMENICLSREEMGTRIEESLSLTGLEKYRLTSPKNLSGGQKQLVVLAAVLALRPAILLLDEVFSQLDETGRSRLMAHIAALRDSGRTIVLVDHNPENLSIGTSSIVIGE
ncbi:MAG: energy-coupling factor ABC transporter ATP-binding protein [Treponema sp.]|nr:energy-coupling factor ABC transporter ATP-binding protein [Treponema sp.]